MYIFKLIWSLRKEDKREKKYFDCLVIYFLLQVEA